MQKEFNLGSLRTTSTMRSLPMPWSEDGKKINQTHTASTSEYWVVYVEVGQLPSASSMRFSSARELENFLKFLDVNENRRKMLLRNLWSVTPASTTLKELPFRGMLVEAGLQDWMDDVLIYLEWTWAREGIWLCLGIFSREKQL